MVNAGLVLGCIFTFAILWFGPVAVRDNRRV